MSKHDKKWDHNSYIYVRALQETIALKNQEHVAPL